MIIRKLAALATTALAISTASGAALASGSFAFDDPYWKQALDTMQAQSSAPAATGTSMTKYEQVDRYNP